MKIRSFTVKNFKGIPDAEIKPQTITLFTGPCGSGKTSFLKAFNFALTGDVKKENIRKGQKEAYVKIIFEDDSYIERVRNQDITIVKVNGRRSSGKAAADFLKLKLETSIETYAAMCNADFFNLLSSKELTEFFLSILPTKITFHKLCEFIDMNENKPLTDEEIALLQQQFPKGDEVFGLEEIETAYKIFYDLRRKKNSEVQVLKPKAEFDTSLLPKKSKEELSEQLEQLTKDTALAENYLKRMREYEKFEKNRNMAQQKLSEMKKSYIEKYKDVKEPDKNFLDKQKNEKQQFLDAIQRHKTTVATLNGNISILQNTLNSLSKNVCPLSPRLKCTADRAGFKIELETQIEKSQKAVREEMAFIKKCEQQVKMRDDAIEIYQNQVIAYNEKMNLQSQIKNYPIPELPEKPEEIKIPDTSMKAAIQNQLNAYVLYENAIKMKQELETAQHQLCLLEKAVSVLDAKKGVRAMILNKILQPFENICNKKAENFRNMEIKITFDDGIQFWAKTGKSGDFIPVNELSAGEHIFVIYLMCCIIQMTTKAKYLVIDNMDKLDSSCMANFIDLLEQDSGYDHIFLGTVNHTDTIDCLKDKNIEIINL